MDKNLSLRLRSIFILFILLGIALLVFRYLIPTATAPRTTHLAFPFTSDLVSRIRINTNKTIDLNRQDGQWYQMIDAMQYPANGEKITSLLNAAFALNTQNIVSTNPQNHSNYGISRNNIVFEDEASHSATLFIGLGETDQEYFRFNNDKEIFTGQGFETALTNTEYRDLRIPLISNEEKVLSILFEAFGSSYKLQKNVGWTINSKTASDEKVHFFVSQLASLIATDMWLPSDTNHLQLGNYVGNITVEEDGTQKKLSIYMVDEKTYSVQTTTNHFTYQLHPAIIEAIRKTEADFMP